MYHLVSGLYAEWTKKARYNVLVVGLSGVGKSCILEKIKSTHLKRPALPPSKIAPTVGQNVFDLSLTKLNLHFWDLGGSPSVRTLWSKYYEETNAVVWVVDARDFLPLTSSAPSIKDKGKSVESDEAFNRREESWSILSDLVTHPSLEGQPILVLANKSDACSSDTANSLQTDERKALTQSIRSWLEHKLAHIGQELPSTRAASTERLPNIFADNHNDSDTGDLGSSTSKAMPGSLTGARDYEWEVIATSAIDGMGMHEAIDWLSIRVQTSSTPR